MGSLMALEASLDIPADLYDDILCTFQEYTNEVEILSGRAAWYDHDNGRSVCHE